MTTSNIVYASPGIERKVLRPGMFPGVVRETLGLTDFNHVYIRPSMPLEDDAIVVTHELCHIWLRHNERSRTKRRSLAPESFDWKLWNVAADLEIARHCYSDSVAAHMSVPFSLTHNGIRREHAAEYPDCEYAEEFYDALRQQQKDIQDKLKVLAELLGGGMDGGNEGQSDDEGQPGEGTPQDAMANAKVKLKEKADGQAKAAAQQKIATQVRAVPKPTLASELDRHLGRYRIVRESSYRRPPRYVPEGGLMRKGKITTPRRPAVAIYVDRSGSFTPAKTAEAESKLAALLSRYGASITHDTLEFSDDCGKNIERGRGTNYEAVHAHVMRDRPKVVIVITDDDSSPPLAATPDTVVLVMPVACAHTALARAWEGAVEVG